MTTNTTMDLQALLKKTTDSDFLREMIGFTAQRLIDLRSRACPVHRMAAAAPIGWSSATATATAPGKPGPEPSSYASRSCARAATSPASWNPAAWRRRH
jgi:hypothetical protein